MQLQHGAEKGQSATIGLLPPSESEEDEDEEEGEPKGSKPEAAAASKVAASAEPKAPAPAAAAKKGQVRGGNALVCLSRHQHMFGMDRNGQVCNARAHIIQRVPMRMQT